MLGLTEILRKKFGDPGGCSGFGRFKVDIQRKMLTMWKRLLGTGLLMRALVRELAGIHAQLKRQGDLLERWMAAAGVTTPEVVQQQARPQDLADTGISFLDPIEQAIVQDYIGRTTKDVGQPPSDEQILSYLADEKTIALQGRLREREALADLDRLSRGTR